MKGKMKDTRKTPRPAPEAASKAAVAKSAKPALVAAKPAAVEVRPPAPQAAPKPVAEPSAEAMMKNVCAQFDSLRETLEKRTFPPISAELIMKEVRSELASLRQTLEKRTVAPAAEPMAKEIRAELAALRQTLDKLAAPPASPDSSLESSVDSMRRLLSELLESRLEPVIAELAAIRALAVSAPRGNAAVERIEALLADLGARRFEASRLDYFDPLIHQAVAERHDSDAPAGVVLETLRPGYRTVRGQIVAKAAVAVNRRD